MTRGRRDARGARRPVGHHDPRDGVSWRRIRRRQRRAARVAHRRRERQAARGRRGRGGVERPRRSIPTKKALAEDKRTARVKVDPSGQYRLCGLPTDDPLLVQVQHDGRAGAVLHMTIPEGPGVLVRDIEYSVSGSRVARRQRRRRRAGGRADGERAARRHGARRHGAARCRRAGPPARHGRLDAERRARCVPAGRSAGGHAGGGGPPARLRHRARSGDAARRAALATRRRARPRRDAGVVQRRRAPLAVRRVRAAAQGSDRRALPRRGRRSGR